MNSTKPELRKLLKARRLALSENERRDKSRAIRVRLQQLLNTPEVRTVHCFEPIREQGEVNIKGFSDPYNIYVISVSRRIDGKWKVVPQEGNKPVPEHFDAVIVPMLGFDSKLHRIGYGGGYYDKFLVTQPDAKKIGVCYEINKIDQIPAEPHDIPLDYIVTEDRTYTP